MLARMPSRRMWPMALPLLLALTLTPAVPVAAAPEPGGAGPLAPPAGAAVTLLTGDQVWLSPAGGGRTAARIEPAPRSGPEPVFETFEDSGSFYVIPSDAAQLVPERLDRELFNVTKLVEYGYTDGVGVIVTGAPARTTAGSGGGMSVTADLPSVGGYAATVAPDGSWWETITGARAAARSGMEKVWLDGVAEIALDQSTVDIGAPQAWAAGYDGAGVTVAVLDTGIDAAHPDLAGQVAAAENFTAEPDTSDGHGHGTHVAGIVAGTGAASGGTYTGVAPGAELLVGKVCNGSGDCLNSQVLAGMQWAAPLADVVSISLGSPQGSDGTDPLSQAVNSLTAAHGTLFVIAAGNNGAQGPGSISSPGAADAALTVGSTDKGGIAVADSSSRGPRLGDYAIKPDLLAPGVGIVAARAAGTSPGPIVDDNYTRLSGTSMATPHVAGAAAILLQQDPGRGPGEVKAALTTTATVGKYPIYDQGAGRVDIPAALSTPVTVDRASLDLGYFPYPHDGTAPVTEEITYTNHSDQQVTLSLSHDVSMGDEGAAPTDLLAIAPSSLTIAPGGKATATVTLDVRDGEDGIYGGYLYASGGFGEVRMAAGFHKERELYELTIRGVARDGRPAGGDSAIHIMNLQSVAEFFDAAVTYQDGTASVRVPPGDYYVMSPIYTYDGHDVYHQSVSIVGTPEIEITEDTSLVLDARDANQLAIDSSAHPEAAPSDLMLLGLYRRTEGTAYYSRTLGMSWIPTYVQETEPVTIGAFELYTRTRLEAPSLALAVTGPDSMPLSPRAMVRSPQVDGEQELPLVWAGHGAPADYDGLDATGAAVLTLRGGPDAETKQAIAEAHGAAALLVMNDTTGVHFDWAAAGGRIPAMTLSGQEGTALSDLLSAGPVSLRLSGTPVSPYRYDLLIPYQDQVPADVRHTVEPAELATIMNTFHDGTPDHLLGEMRFSWRPHEFYGLGVSEPLAAGARTDYLAPDDTLYRHDVAAHFVGFAGGISGPASRYQAGDTVEQTWFGSPVRPGITAGDPLVRSGDTLTVRIPEFLDSDPTHVGWLDGRIGDTSAFRLYQDGELIGQAPYARGSFPLRPDPATYRLELDTARPASWWQTSTATRTVWTVHSEPGQDLLPALVVEYDLDLDLTNTAVDPTPVYTIGLRAQHQPGVDGPPIAGAEVSVSYDDGASWQPLVTHPSPGRGAFTALITPNRAPPAGADTVSLRVAVADEDGNRLEQEIIDAWRLP